MGKVIKLANGKYDELISISEAANLIGEEYNTAYKIIFIRKEISHQDRGKRNKKVYKKSAEAYRDAHRVQGKF